MIYTGIVPMMIPTAATRWWLAALRNAICEGCPAGTGVGTPPAALPFFNTVSLMLNTNAVDPACGLVFADLVVTDDTGGAPIVINEEAAPGYCSVALEGPAEGLDGYWRLVYDQQIWTAAGDGTTAPQITGLILHDTGSDEVLAYGQLPNGPANFETGDIVKLVMDLPLRCQLPL